MDAQPVFECVNCGAGAEKRYPRCNGCGRFNAYREIVADTEVEVMDADDPRLARVIPLYKSTFKPFETPTIEAVEKTSRVVRLYDVEIEPIDRIPTDLDGLDWVFGYEEDAGLPLCAAILLGGEPGAGKSTLMLKALGKLASLGVSCTYGCGEESLGMIRNRAERLEVFENEEAIENLHIIATNEWEEFEDACKETDSMVCLLDSLNVFRKRSIASAPASELQVTALAESIQNFAHGENEYRGLHPRTVVAISHVTKDGILAGPQRLKHWVDVVAKLTHRTLDENGRGDGYVRLSLDNKNRFGTIMRESMSAMTGKGLIHIANNGDPEAWAEVLSRPALRPDQYRS